MATQLKNILRQGGLKLRAAYDASGVSSLSGKKAVAAEVKVNAELQQIKESVRLQMSIGCWHCVLVFLLQSLSGPCIIRRTNL